MAYYYIIITTLWTLHMCFDPNEALLWQKSKSLIDLPNFLICSFAVYSKSQIMFFKRKHWLARSFEVIMHNSNHD